MVQVYVPGNENFAKNGDASLFCFTCDLSVELNGTWMLTMEIPIDDEGRWKYVAEEAVLKVDTWQEDKQLYRIAKVEKQDASLTATAYPIFFDSANDAFLMDVRPTNKNGQQALDIMCDGTPYSGRSDIATVTTAYFVRRNLMDAISGSASPTFLERWGGEIVYDNYTVSIMERQGGDYGVEARYGRNIRGVTYVVDTDGIITRIVPIAYNGYLMSGSEPWVDSANIDSYAKIYTREVRYEHIKMAADAGDDEDAVVCHNQSELDAALLAAAQADFAAGCDTPTVTIDIDMLIVSDMASRYEGELLDSDADALLDTEGEEILTVWYRDYASLETVRLGDTIRCRHTKLDITSTARVIALTWDCIDKKVTHVTLGDYKQDYVRELSSAINRVNNSIRDDGSLIAEKVRGFIDGANAQLRTQYNLATRQDTMAILFENLDEDSPMYGALGIGTQGICISKTRTEDGRDWDWTTGITANGMNASMGVFGILADKLGINWINLDTGEISLGGSTLIGNQTVSEYMDTVQGNLDDYIASNDQAIANIQSQLDGSIESYFEDYAPTLNNYPANEWTTPALRQQHEGDLFYDKTTGNSYRFFQNAGVWSWTLITDTAATQALAIASQAKDTADGKRRVFVSTPTPPYDVGDLYMDGSEIKVCMTAKTAEGTYSSADFVRRDAYAENSAFQAFVTQYSSDMADMQDALDGKIETWRQSDDPASGWTTEQRAEHVGDLWYNTSSGKTYFYTGSAWSETTSTPPASVISTINAKANIWISQPTPPYKAGDLWFDGSTADIMTCITARASGSFTASDWEKRNKYTDDSALNAYKAEIADITDDLQGQLDDKIETWYQASDPSTAWTAYSEDFLLDTDGNQILDTSSQTITTVRESEKANHTGDLWHNTTTNAEYRWTGAEWVEMAVPNALMDKVDGKRTIFSAQPTPPYMVNDLWAQGADGDILICVKSRDSGAFVSSDWEIASKYTDDSGLMSFISGSYANTISTLQTQIDGRAETWYQSADPSTSWTDKPTHKGDLWYKTTDSTTWYYTGSAWQQMNVPLSVFDTIDTKAQIFASQPVPPYFQNDIWFTGTDILVSTRDRASGAYVASDWVKKDYYTDDSALAAFLSGDYATFVASTADQLDQKAETWYQSADPSTAWTKQETNVPLLDSSGNSVLDTNGQEIITDFNIEAYEHTGDIWYRTSDSTQWRYTGGGWEQMNAPKEVFDAIDGKSSIYTSQSAPANPQERDLWFRGTAYPIYTFVGGKWQEYNKYTSDENLDSFVDGVFTPWQDEVNQDVDTIFQALDGEIIAAVVSGDIVNAINLSREGIKIDATKLNINGVTSINNYFKVLSDGKMEAAGGKIGNIIIASDKIYSSGHDTATAATAGFMLGSDGTLSVGNASSYLRWTKNSSNEWNLDMKVSSLTIGGTTAATTTDTGNAAKTATNYLYYSANDGLVISATGGAATASGSQDRPYNTQILAGGIYFRKGTGNLAKVTGTDFTIYHPNRSNAAAMSLTTEGLFFYKTDGSTVSAKYTSNGFEVLTGKIGSEGFTIDSKSIYRGALGESGSVFLSAGTTAAASIGGSESISGWAITAGADFGVTRSGALYAKSAKISGTLTVENGSTIGGWTIRDSRLANADNSVYLGTNGFKLGDNFSVNQTGNLSAAGANISGTINATGGTFSGTVTVTGEIKASTGKFSGKIEATSGSIGGWTIDSKQLYTGSPGSSGGVYLSPAGYKGDNDQGATICDVTSTDWVVMAGSNFGVKKDGSVYARSGKIADFTIAQKTLSSSVTSNDVTYTVSIRSGTNTSTKAIQVGTSSTDAFYVTYGGNMVATKGSIAGITMESGSIYSNSHSTYNSSNAGFLLKSDGTFSVGDNSSYIRYYYDSSSSSWKMAINAASLSFGGYTVAKQSDVQTAQNTANSAVTAAATAQSTADTAKTNAATAQTTANTANTNAATAQTTANAKSRTFTGTSVPTPPYDVGDIWISGNTSEHKTRYCTTARASGKGYASDWSQTASQAAANAADTKAGNALSAAESAGAAALDAQEAAENAAKTATNYMTFVAGTGDGTGLFLAQSSNYSSGANMRLTSDLIQIRSSNTPKMEISATAMRFYRGSGNNLKTAMKLDDDELIFYKKNGSDVAATIGANGIEVKSGIIGGFSVSSSNMTTARYNDSEGAYATFYLRPPTSATTKFLQIAKAKDPANPSAKRSEFYVNGSGFVCCSGISVGGHYDAGGNLHNPNFYMTLDPADGYLYVGSLHVTDSKIEAKNINVGTGNTMVYTPDAIGSWGTIKQTASSSIRYKNPVEDMTYDYAKQVLDITPTIFRYKYGYLEEGDESAGKEIPGFYAEDVEEHFPIGVYHNLNGTVENWKPERIIPAMLRIMQEQQKEIERLKEAMA